MINIGNTKQEKLNKESLQFEMHKKSNRINFFYILKNVIKLIGRFFAACILLVIAGHFVPELREMLPELYIFIEDFVFKLFNGLYGWVNNLIF